MASRRVGIPGVSTTVTAPPGLQLESWAASVRVPACPDITGSRRGVQVELELSPPDSVGLGPEVPSRFRQHEPTQPRA